MFPVKVETRILLNCPHCRFSSRYDTGFLEDAIHDHKEISCVACGGHFLLSVVAVEKAVQQNAHQTGGGLCAECGSPSWAHGAIGHAFIPPHPQVA